MQDSQTEEPPGYRQLPHNIEAEQGLLGALLIDNAALDKAGDILQPHHFYAPAHQRIFEAIRCMVERGQVASPVSLKNLFEQDEALERAGGAEYLADLATSSLGTFNVPDYARTIYDLFLRRDLIAYTEDIAEQARHPHLDRTALETIEQAEERLYQLASAKHSSQEARPIIEGYDKALHAIDKAQRGENPCIKSGIAELDDKLGGFFRKELYILAARPSMGKTALALNFAYNAARAGNKVLFFSLEMPEEQLAGRIIARETGIGTDVQRKGNVTAGQSRDVVAARGNIEALPLYVDEQVGLTIGQIRSRIRRHMRRQGADLVVIDYLEMIRATNPAVNRTYQIQEITIGLKSAAKDFDVPIVLLAQINRGVESRDDKRPTLSDLKDSGAIEQDADAVMFLYRHHYYLSKQQPQKKSGEEIEAFQKRLAIWHTDLAAIENQAEVIIGKIRQGQTGTVSLPFDPVRQVFGDSVEQSSFSPALVTEGGSR